MPLYCKGLTNGLQYASGWLLVSSVRSVLSSDICKLNYQYLGGYSPIYHCGGPGSIPGQSVWNLWWTMWQQDEFFPPSTSVIPCQNGPDSILDTRCSYQKDERATTGGF